MHCGCYFDGSRTSPGLYRAKRNFRLSHGNRSPTTHPAASTALRTVTLWIETTVQTVPSEPYPSTRTAVGDRIAVAVDSLLSERNDRREMAPASMPTTATASESPVRRTIPPVSPIASKTRRATQFCSVTRGNSLRLQTVMVVSNPFVTSRNTIPARRPRAVVIVRDDGKSEQRYAPSSARFVSDKLHVTKHESFETADEMSDARGRVDETGPSTESVRDELPVEVLREHSRLTTALSVGVGLDVVTTTVGVPMDGITETNPVVAAAVAVIGWPAFPLYYLLLGTLFAGVIRLGPVPRRWLVRIGWIAVLVLAATVCNNVYVLLTHG